MPVNIAENKEINNSVRHTVKTDYGDLAVDIKEDDKGDFHLNLNLGGAKCSFVVSSDWGDVKKGTASGDCADILNLMLQHLFSGAYLKMK